MAVCFRVFLLVTSLNALAIAVAGTTCISTGFPPSVPQCADSSCVTRDSELNGNRVSTIIVPEMSFTCSGTVTHWRAAGVFRTGGNADTNSVLSIWRERSNEAGKYDRIGRIELGICGSENPAPSVSGVYECALATNMVLVQSGDIIGIELPSANSVKFQLHFYDTNSGPANYVFDSHNSPLSLSEATQRGQPQILLTVMPDSMPTTTTEATPTDPPTTTQDTTSTSTTSDPTTTRDDVTDPQPNVPATTTMSAEIPTSTGNVQNTQAPTMPMTNGPTTRDDVTDPQPPMTNSMATSTSIEQSTTTEATVSTMNTEPAIMGDSTTTLDSTITSTIPPSGDGGNRFVQPDSNSDANNIGPIAGAVVGSIIAVLLFLIIVLLLVLVLRRQNQNRKKFTPSNNATIVNPIYNDDIELQVRHTNDGGVTGAEGIDHTPAVDYEYIDDVKPSLPSLDMFVNSINDYSRTPHPFEMSTYEVPVQSTMPKNLTLGDSFANVGVLYVPSQEQRNSLSKNITNGDVYSAIGMRQYSEYGATPKLFEEDDTYWEPASDANELYKQLSAKKYREIVRQQIQTTSHLGSGQFGTVSKGIWQSPMGALDVAVKQLQPGASEEEKVKFLQEAAINGQFRHPNIVKLMGVVTVGEPTMIVLEMLSNGDLLNYLHKLQPSPGEILPSNIQQLLLKFCQQVSSGMDYLARKAFVHRDLAARNILVADDKTCKISDFGMSRDLMDENYYVSHGGKVPVKWTAPEALHYKKYSTASDVWSYGCVMYEIWSLGHKPFEEHRNAEVIKTVDEGYRLPPPPGLPKELYKIMIQCWHPDRSSRPTFPQLVEMLSRADFELFVWEEEDLRNSDPQVKLIGAPLEVAKDLYHELQRSYLSS